MDWELGIVAYMKRIDLLGCHDQTPLGFVGSFSRAVGLLEAAVLRCVLFLMMAMNSSWT